MENTQCTPNRMSLNSVTDENQNVLITRFKSSPKTPRAASEIAKKKSAKKKRGKKTRRPNRSSVDGQSSELSTDSRRSQGINRQVVNSPYNLIEFYGDRSRSESSRDNSSVPGNRNDVNANRITGSFASGANDLNSLQASSALNGEFNSASIPVSRSPQKVIFVIPENWAATIEILKLPTAAFLNSVETSSAYEEDPNSVGPIRSHAKTYRNRRNRPYYSSSRRRGEGSDYARGRAGGSIAPPAAQSSAKSEADVEFSRYYTAGNGYEYGQLDFRRTSDSIGPIRQRNKRRAHYTPYGSGARERGGDNSLSSAGTSPCESPTDSFNAADSHTYGSGRRHGRYFDNYSSSRRPRRCWNCREKGHIRINCPLL